MAGSLSGLSADRISSNNEIPLRIAHALFFFSPPYDDSTFLETGGADLLERILDRNNLDRAHKQVGANHEAVEIEG